MIHVHDGVLADPMAYRAAALMQRFQSVQGFRGIAACEDPAIALFLVEHYPELTPTLSFFRRSPLGQEEPNYVHHDATMGDWTAIYYMNPNPPEGDGSRFWVNRATGAARANGTGIEAASWANLDAWECYSQIGARFNRLIVFPAELFHSRAILENYGESDDTARLVQVVFGQGRV